MIDPRTGSGIFLCALSVLATAWLYARDFRDMPNRNWKKWPWLGFLIIAIEITFPGFLLATKAESPSSSTVVQDQNDIATLLRQFPVQVRPPLQPMDQNNHFKDIHISGAHTGIKIDGGGGNHFEGVTMDNVENGLDMHDTQNNSFKNMHINENRH